MSITDSKQLYEVACRSKESYIKNLRRYGYGTSPDLESYYIQIICMMFCELIKNKESTLLSWLCSVNKIRVEATNFNIDYEDLNTQRTYFDLLPILDGLNMYFSAGFEECRRLYRLNYQQYTFDSSTFNNNSPNIEWLKGMLQLLDENIKRTIAVPVKSVNETQSKIKTDEAAEIQNINEASKTERLQKTEEHKKSAGDSKTKVTAEVEGTQGVNGVPKAEETLKTKASELIIQTHDLELTEKLNKYAEDRRADDAALSKRIEKLQLSLQNELQEIMSIRDGINYEILQEAIRQFILLFSLVSETLKYHPDDKNKDSYYNLIGSSINFLAHVEQSLTRLGVTVINDIGKPFAPKKHKAAPGCSATLGVKITKVVKIGFEYKNIVLEKAEVELAKAK